MDTDWKDKSVIVTGGAGGMGQAAAVRFAEAGARTYVLGRTQESLQATAQLSEKITPLVEQTGGGVFWTHASSIIPGSSAGNVEIPRITMLTAARVFSGSTWMG